MTTKEYRKIAAQMAALLADNPRMSVEDLASALHRRRETVRLLMPEATEKAAGRAGRRVRLFPSNEPSEFNFAL